MLTKSYRKYRYLDNAIKRDNFRNNSFKIFYNNKY